MANPNTLNIIASGGVDPVARPNWDAMRANALRAQETQQAMGQRNALFSQQQEDRQRQMQMQQQEKQNAEAREALAGYFMTPEPMRGQYYQGVAAKFGLPPDGDHKQIVGGVIQSNPGILGPELSSKILQKEFAQQMGEGPASVQEWQFMNSLPRGDQQKFLEMKRAQKTIDLGSSIGVLGAGGQIARQYDKELPPQNQPGNVQAQEEAKQRGEAKGAAAAKAPAQGSMNYVINELREANKNVSTGGPMGIKGKAAYVYDYQDAARFDNLAQQLSTEMRTVYRIPGEGTLSDREQAQYGIQLPSRNYSPEVNDKILKDLESRTEIRLGQQPAPAVQAPTQAGAFNDPEKERRYQEWKAKQGK